MAKKWREIFLELSLRALRKTHYEFGVWELGQNNLTLEHFKNLNQGNGIDFAPEESIRDSILQEITYTGLWKEHQIENDPTSYWIDREVKVSLNKKKAIELDLHKKFFNIKDYSQSDKYVEDDKIFKIDIVFKRIQKENNDKEPTYPSLIEAKRFRLINIDHKTNTLIINEPQINRIDKDILKLKMIREYYQGKKINVKGDQYDNFYTYILLWGTSLSNFNLKDEVINNLERKEYLLSNDYAIRYCPIEWEFDDKLKELKVKRLLWISLIELK